MNGNDSSNSNNDSNNAMKIIFMGTPAFALPTLKALHESAHEVVAVYSQSPRPAGRGQKETPSPVHVYAQENHIPVLTPTSLKSPEAQDAFAALNADIAVVVAYGLILPTPILQGARLGCINVHPSKLPRWRGAAPIQRTIMTGDRETSICIMQMDAGLDTGDILLEKPYAIAPGTSAGLLHDTLANAAPSLVLEAIEGLQKKTITPQKQPTDGVTYADKISKDEAQLDLSQPAEIVLQKILGLSPFPGAWFEYKGARLKILNASLTPQSQFKIECSNGAIYPTEVQQAGKKRMNVDEFLLGFKP